MKICNEGVDLATAELEAQKVEMAEEAKRKAEEEAEKARKKAQAQQEMRELHARLLELKKEGGELNQGVVAVDVNDNEFESESDGEAVTYDPVCIRLSFTPWKYTYIHLYFSLARLAR
jgi:hypothetical protein